MRRCQTALRGSKSTGRKERSNSGAYPAIRTDPRGFKAKGAAKAALCGQGRIQYPLLGAASRRFRGAGVANAPVIRVRSAGSALAGNGDVFAAAAAAAFFNSAFGNRTGNF